MGFGPLLYKEGKTTILDQIFIFAVTTMLEVTSVLVFYCSSLYIF